MNNYTVYMHVAPNNKKYIGITCQKVNRRWREGKGYTCNKHFTNAINKYGWESIEHIIVARNLAKEEAMWLEIEMISAHETTNPKFGYNASLGGETGNGLKGESHPMYGKHHSEESRRKISEAQRGENNHMFGKRLSKEARESISKRQQGDLNSFYGKNHTDEVKAKMSETRTGKGNARAKSVICTTTKKVFFTAKEGAEYYSIVRQDISKCCKGKRKSAGKYNGQKLVWRYLNWNHNKTYRIA